LKSQSKRIVSIYTRPGNKEKYITAKKEENKSDFQKIIFTGKSVFRA
jgi:hypothetical protein